MVELTDESRYHSLEERELVLSPKEWQRLKRAKTRVSFYNEAGEKTIIRKARNKDELAEELD